MTDEQGECHDLHVAYIWSSEEQASVENARRRALEKAEEDLVHMKNGLGGRYYKTKKQVDDRVAVILSGKVAGLIDVETGEQDGRPTITWSRDEGAVAKAGELDGLYALATNLRTRGKRRVPALEVLKVYKDQWVVEQRHRDLKQTLRVRPVFLHNDARIEALVAVVGIALLVFGLVEAELREALGDNVALPGALPEGRAAKPTACAALTAFDGLQVTYTENDLVLDQLNQVQRLILTLLGIPLPWPEKRED